MDQLSTQTDYEFGGFRLDTVLQVLVSPEGNSISLPARSYDVLRYLIERAGELVDRGALMRAVWPNTIVEENNLNQCVVTLRRALGETAGERRFILTVPGRGFKFVAPVRAVYAERAAPDLREIPVLTETRPDAAAPPTSMARLARLWRPRILILGVVTLSALTGLVAWMFRERTTPATSSMEYQALTDLGDSATAPAVSPDGKMLAFIGGGPAFLSEGQIFVKLLPSGDPVQLTHATGPIYAPAFSADGTRIAFTLLEKRDGSLSWDTWTVPVTGGPPSLLLKNAAGLSWISPRELLYSEIKSGLHMGIATSTDDRSGHRDIYLPAHERAMAHYSYLSPDRHFVLVVEMDGAGDWRRCRLLPFDGSTSGAQVGPVGHCQSAAWSPDGRWMYFAAQVAGHSHLWRERFPDGPAEQITFGPTEEESVAVAPDGRSLMTALGELRESIWLHDANGERALTNENVAYEPWLAPDARHLYFLASHQPGEQATLWRMDVQQGQRELLLPGKAVTGYAVTLDERQVIFTLEAAGVKQIWAAPLDHVAPPMMLANSADQPAVDGSGHVFFRLLGGTANYLYRMNADGSSKQQMLGTPILDFLGVSPTGKWAAVHTVIDGNGMTSIEGIDGQAFRWARNGSWAIRWSPDGRMLYLEVGSPSSDSLSEGWTLPVALSGDAAPRIPALPLASADGVLKHATWGFSPGSDAQTYAFTRAMQLQNIYRIPLHL